MSDFTKQIADYSRARLMLLCSELHEKLTATEEAQSEPIAIVGMACRFPGSANDPDSYWQLLEAGVDAISEIPRDRWNVDGFYDADPNAPGKMYCRKGGFIDQVDGFDPEFFNLSPRETLSLDPQHRLALEVTWEALENAGQDPNALRGSRTGVFLGIGTDDYAKIQVRDLDAKDVSVYTGIGNAYCYAAGRISYFLDLHGPCLPVDTACSSSLVAIHLACHSLRSGECDAALAGGVQLILAPFAPVFLSKARALAPDGRAKTFDASADGFSRGEGCGVLLLRRLSDALARNDRIHAVIRATAVNHDGHSSAFTVPNGVAQQEVIRTALHKGNVDPLEVGYIEAHGTGTSLGDPIELNALAAVYGRPAGRSERALHVGSVKTNFGHLEGAAGVAGLIKAVLSVQHGVIPPHLNFDRVNPHISLSDGPFVIPTQCTAWDRPRGSRIAAVSSFGLSGTNAHVIISDAPAPKPSTASGQASPLRPLHLFALSAKSESALRQLAARYVDALDGFRNKAITDICHTANTGRAHFSHRLTAIVKTPRQLKRQLSAFVAKAADAPVMSVTNKTRPKPVFLFSGQGSQYLGMGRALYESQPTFRTQLARCDEACRPLLNQSLLDIIFENGEQLDDTTYQQPALFALEYSLAQLWLSWGIEPALLIGHSVGEIAAACFAGVFSLEDGLKLVTARGRLMGSLPRNGRMVATLASEPDVSDCVRPWGRDISIAAVNGPESVVISGLAEAMDEAIDALKSRGIQTRPLNVSHAFHSPLMEPILDQFEREVAAMSLRRPRFKLMSNVTGELAGDEITTAAYWRRHLRDAVRFSASIESAYAQGSRVFLEVGPKPVLCALGKRCVPARSDSTWLASLEPERDWQSCLESLAALYRLGAVPDWKGFDQGYDHEIVTLPSYAFQRRRHWVDLTRPVSNACFMLESEVRQDRELSTLLDHLLGAWGEDGAQAINRRMTAQVLFFPSAMKSLFYVARSQQSLVVLDYVGPDESFESSLAELVDAVDDHGWTLTLLAQERWSGTLARLGWSTTPIGIWQALPDLRNFSLDGGERKRLRSKVNTYRNLGNCSTTRYVVGSSPELDAKVLELIDDWVERKGRRAAFVDMLKHEISTGTLDARYRLYLTHRDDSLDSVVLLSPCGRNRGFLMDLEFYRRDMSPGCLEFSITEIIGMLRDEGFNYFSVGSTFGTQLSRHEQENPEVAGLLRVFYEQNILNSDSNYSFKKKFVPQPSTAYLCRREPSDISDLPQVLRLLAEPDPNPTLEGFDEAVVRNRPSHRSRSTALEPTTGHPLLGKELALAVSEKVFETTLEPGGSAHSFLNDHQVFGQVILPGTAYLELARAGIAKVLRSAVELRDVMLLQPLAVSGGAPPGQKDTRLQLIVAADTGQQATFRICSEARQAGSDETAWTEHVTGSAIAASSRESTCITLEQARAACPDDLPVDSYYEDVRALGMEFGPAFQGLQQAWQGEHQALGLVRLPGDPGDEAPRYQAHPALLDACLHVQSALLLSLRSDDASTFLPVSIGRLRLLEPLGREVWSHARLRPVADERPDTLIADYTIYDASGKVLAQIEGFVAKRTSREAIEFLLQTQRTDLNSLTYELRWEVQQASGEPADTEPGYWLILDDASPVSDRLKLRFEREHPAEPCFRVVPRQEYGLQSDGRWSVNPADPSHFGRLFEEIAEGCPLPCRGVIHLWGSMVTEGDQTTIQQEQFLGCGSTLHLVQALADAQQHGRAADKCPLWLVTRGVQTIDRPPPESTRQSSTPATLPWQAPLWGLGRSIAQEHPELWGGLIDLEVDLREEDANNVFREIQMSDGEDNIAYRDDQRYVARLRRARVVSSRSRAAFDPDATQLITGGLGGLGLAVAAWMVDRGARHIALVSRNAAPSSDARLRIAEMEQSGAQVAVFKADVARLADVQTLLAEVAAQMPPLEGILHAAGTLADGALLQQSWDRFEDVMAAKVDGSWNLHQLSAGLSLSYFACFSSIASLLGTAGQANYAAANAFMDSLAHYRRGVGLPALSIHWGPWADVGMAARLSSRASSQRAAHGVAPIAPKQCLQVLDSILSGTTSPTEIGVIAVDWERLLQSALRSLKGGSLLRELTTATATLSPAHERSAILTAVLEAQPTDRPTLMTDYLATTVATIAKTDAKAIDREQPLTEMGFDSLMALEFRERVETDLEVTVPVMALFRGDSVTDFSALLLGELSKRHPDSFEPGALSGNETAYELLERLDELDDQTVEALLKTLMPDPPPQPSQASPPSPPRAPSPTGNPSP